MVFLIFWYSENPFQKILSQWAFGTRISNTGKRERENMSSIVLFEVNVNILTDFFYSSKTMLKRLNMFYDSKRVFLFLAPFNAENL